MMGGERVVKITMAIKSDIRIGIDIETMPHITHTARGPHAPNH